MMEYKTLKTKSNQKLLKMKHRKNALPHVLVMLVVLAAVSPGLSAQDWAVENWEINPDRELNPNTKWLREARWGLFTHYMVHMPSAPVPDDMTGKKWNKKVNSFKVKEFADQLTALKVPYFFITIGQGGGYYCSPNKTYEKTDYK